jgi:hypothetical protein
MLEKFSFELPPFLHIKLQIKIHFTDDLKSFSILSCFLINLKINIESVDPCILIAVNYIDERKG